MLDFFGMKNHLALLQGGGAAYKRKVEQVDVKYFLDMGVIVYYPRFRWFSRSVSLGLEEILHIDMPGS